MELLSRVCNAIGPLDADAMDRAASRQNRLTKPPGSLGRLEELSIRIAGIQGTHSPSLERKVIVTIAADHGVVHEGVSSFPQEVTAQMVLNFCRGGAGINVLGRHVGARVVVADFGVAGEYHEPTSVVVDRIGRGTMSMAQGPAMSRDQAVRSLEAGIRLVERESDSGMQALATGEMGIGNTTAAAAITAVLTKSPIEQVTGRGAGLTDEKLVKKIDMVRRAISTNEPDPTDGLDVLAKLGGFEIGGMAGAMLAAAARRCPVVVDGFISTAAAALAVSLVPRVKEYLIAGHLSAEGGHRHLLSHLGLEPLVDLGLRLGEGTGAAIGLFLAEAAVRLLNEMATFDEAGVADGTE